MDSRFQTRIALYKDSFTTKLLRFIYNCFAKQYSNTFALNLRADSQFGQLIIIKRMIHLTQSTYTDRLIFIKSHQNSSSLIQNIFLWMIQSLVIGLFHPKISSYPLFVKGPEGRLIARFIRNYFDVLTLSFLFRFLHPLQQGFIQQKILPFFDSLPKVIPGLLRDLLNSCRNIYTLFRKRVGHSFSFGR